MVVAFLLAGHCPRYVRKMVDSVHEVLGCEVVQMSDAKTPAAPGVDRVQRLAHRSPLMVYRFEHILALPDADHRELLILDSDVLVKRDVRDVFEQDFEVALTARAHALRYNTGVMFSKGREFWRACLDRTYDFTPDYKEWWGDQFAVRDVAQTGLYKVRELPCSEYNWSPKHEGDTSDAYIWHYKGQRKDWMMAA